MFPAKEVPQTFFPVVSLSESGTPVGAYLMKAHLHEHVNVTSMIIISIFYQCNLLFPCMKLFLQDFRRQLHFPEHQN
jgi:hypothetical protein